MSENSSENYIDEDSLPIEPELIADVIFDDVTRNAPASNGLNAIEPRDYLFMTSYRCIVCSHVPYSSIFHCENMHSMCGGCYQMRVLDKMLGTLLNSCPSCYVRLNREEPIRGFLMENSIAEIRVYCGKCSFEMPRRNLRAHERLYCPKRTVACKLKRLGCKWTGTYQCADEHVECCEFGSKSGSELLEAFNYAQREIDKKKSVIRQIMALLHLPHITVRLLHLMPSSERYLEGRLFEKFAFHAYNRNWELVFHSPVPCNPITEDVNEFGIYCQIFLQLTGDFSNVINISYTLIGGTYSEVRLCANLCNKIEFSPNSLHGPSTLIYKNTLENCFRVYSDRGLYVRLLMSRH